MWHLRLSQRKRRRRKIGIQVKSKRKAGVKSDVCVRKILAGSGSRQFKEFLTSKPMDPFLLKDQSQGLQTTNRGLKNID